MSELKLDQRVLEVAPGSVQTNTGTRGSSDRWAQEELPYWRQKLAGIPAILELPTDRPRPPVQSFRAARESVTLSRSLKQALEALSEQEGVSLFVVLLAAFQSLLMRYTRQDDIVVGVALPCPEEKDAGELNHDFRANTAVRTDMSGDPTFQQLLARVGKEASGAHEHQNVPWGSVIGEVLA